jgi:hypothetical protein
MKSYLLFSFIIVIYSKLPNRTPTQKEIEAMKDFYYLLGNFTNTSTPEEIKNVVYRNINYKLITIDTATEINIDNIIKDNNLPIIMKGFISEIIKENDMDEVYERFYGLKDSLGLVETTQEYAIHLQTNYEGDFKIIYIMYSESKIGIAPKIETIEKSICNKGFLIESCKNVNIYKFVSFLNDEDGKKIIQPTQYYNQKMMMSKLNEIYGFEK